MLKYRHVFAATRKLEIQAHVYHHMYVEVQAHACHHMYVVITTQLCDVGSLLPQVLGIELKSSGLHGV